MDKVLVITEEGRGGGAIGRMRLIAEALQGKIETIVLAPRSASRYISSLEDKEIPVETIRMHPLSTNLIYILKYIIWFMPEIWRIVKIIKKVNPDIVHCNGSWQIKGILAARIMGVKSVWQMNDTYQPKAVLFFFKLISRLPFAFIYASARTKEYYNDISYVTKRAKERIIQAPVVRQTTKNRREHILRRTPVRMILIGYINHHKGIDILIQTLSKFDKSKVICDVVGPILDTRADYKKGLDEMAKEHGVNLNYLGYQKVDAKLFAEYDFYCCSSRREASPMSVWEALSFGVPIISTPVGDITHVVEEFGCGIVARDISPHALAEAIRKALLIDQPLYDKMSTQSYKASSLFDHREIAAQYLHFYTEVISA